MNDLKLKYARSIANEALSKEQIMRQLDNDFVYADVVRCYNGVMSTGAFDSNCYTILPLLYLTLDEAITENKDAQLPYVNSSDEYEGVVMAVRWRDDNILEFYDIEDEKPSTTAHIECTVKAAIGC